MADVPPENNNQEPNFWRQVGRYSHLGFVLPASVAVGMAIGYGLDRWLHTTWLMLVGLFAGSVAGFTELIREMMKASKEP